jgi:hypothetical protein
VKKFWVSWIALTALSLPAWGQKVEVQKQDRSQILHVRTAFNHLTVLEMNEPVSTVAVGSPMFKVEWRESRVFIEPTEPNVATNLFVWTASGRFNYELDPAGAVGEMDFAIDQPVPEPRPVKSLLGPSAAPDGPKASQILLESKPVRTDRLKVVKKRVGVLLNETFQYKDQLFVRFTIRNESKQLYAAGIPQVLALNPQRYRGSLHAISNSQLSDKDAARLKSNGQTPLELVKGEMRSARVGPGQETVGVVGVKLPDKQGGPVVLRLVFPAAPTGPLNATLVL